MIRTDRVPQRVLDRQVWHAVHGPGSKPPPPGPNAAGTERPRPRRIKKVSLP